MALSLGSSLATKVYLGATEINLAYFGATQVYSSAAFSAEAQNYFSRLDAAGDTTYVDYKQPLANYIDGLVALGGAYWNNMVSACSFVGVGIQGITVPLRSGMTVPTNNNFVAADLDQLTGLVGDGSTKWMHTNTIDSDVLQDDASLSCWVSDIGTQTTARFIGSSDLQFNTNNPNTSGLRMWSQSTTRDIPTGFTTNNFAGINRSTGTGYNYLVNGISGAFTRASLAPAGQPVSVFSSQTFGRSDVRLATYHFGPALNLATLEALQDTLLSEVAAAKAAAAAESYFSRLAAAGDTTHVAYKQPLTNYISSLVALGGAYWDDMLSACSFVGVGIQGVTVPLRDGMTVPTNNNFVAGDLNQLTGLKGDASTKYIDTNITGSSLTQNDFSLSAYAVSNLDTGNLLAQGGGSGGASQISADGKSRCQNGTQNSSGFSGLGLCGVTRDNSANYDISVSGSTATVVIASQSPAALDQLVVFANWNVTAVALSAARLATYHVGPALNLATLEALQDTLLTEIAAVAAAVEIAAFAAESGATDLTGLTNLVTYLKQESLYDNFVIYPMISAQNAGSGSTVYSLGGLTANDMTLANSPSWSANGLVFNGTNQDGTISDFLASGETTFFARMNTWTPTASSTVQGIIAHWDSSISQRSTILGSRSSAEAFFTSTDGTAVQFINPLGTPAASYAVDRTYVSNWSASNGNSLWRDNTLADNAIAAATLHNSTADISIMRLNGSSNYATGTMKVAAMVEGVTLTTTQREAITDYINAL